jgi:trans-aconitate methyltransferase
VARRGRRLIFQAKFAGSDDPWQYETMPYEVRKRSLLVASVPPSATAILEIGCADGFNLCAWGEARPSARVIGLEISPRAVEAARRRAQHLPQVTAVETDISGAVKALESARAPRFDVVVLAEILYYLGGPADIRRQLQPLTSLLAPECLIVMLHPTRDAEALHAAAFAALEASVETRNVVPDPERPYVLQSGHRTTAASSEGPCAARPSRPQPARSRGRILGSPHLCVGSWMVSPPQQR